jgi:hypothetical protein
MLIIFILESSFKTDITMEEAVLIKNLKPVRTFIGQIGLVLIISLV